MAPRILKNGHIDSIFVAETTQRLSNIDKRLDNIESWQKAFGNNDQERYEDIKEHMIRTREKLEKLDGIEEHLAGCVDKPGLIIRVDRAERSLDVMRKIVWVLTSAIIVGAVKAIFDIF